MMCYMVKQYNSHLDYDVVNVEWALNNSGHTLCSLMGNYLDISNRDSGRDLLRYAGMLDYYVRNEYGYEYTSSRDVNSVLTSRYMRDPWNREFLVFPYDVSSRVGNHSYEGYYSKVVYNRVYGGEVKSDIKHNVILLTTTVHGSVVYCLDILAGVYNKT